MDIFQDALIHAAFPIAIVDKAGQYHFINHAFGNLLGISPESAPKLALFEHFPNLNESDWQQSSSNCTDRQNLTLDLRLPVSKGHTGHYSAELRHLENGGESRFCLTLREVSDFASQEQLPPELLRQAKELSFAVENALVGITLYDHDGNFHYANQSACQMLGYTQAELCQMNLSDVDLNFSPQQLNASLLRGDRKVEEVPVFETVFRRKDQSLLPVEITVNSKNIEGVEYLCSFSRDISSEKEQSKRIAQFSFLIENATDAVYILDASRTILHVNQVACNQTGYDRKDLIGSKLEMLAPHVGTEEGLTQFEQRLGHIKVFESKHRRKDGSFTPIEISNAITEIDGELYIIAFVRDITERKKAIKDMQEMNFALENASDAIYLYDAKGDIYYANKSASEALGYSKDELTSLNLKDIDPSFSLQNHELLWQQAPLEKLPPIEVEHVRKDGSRYPVEISAVTTVFDGHKYAAAFVRNITERKRSLKQLEEWRFAIENINEPVYFYDEQANLTYANKYACQITGYNLQEIRQMTIFDLDPTVRPDFWPQMYEAVKSGKLGSFESINRRKDGTTFEVEVVATNMSYEDSNFGCSVNRDISERKQAERLLELTKLGIDAAKDSIFYHDAEGRFFYANQQAYTKLGYSAEELYQLTIMDIATDVDSDRWPGVWEQLLNSDYQIFETRHSCKDGSSFPVEITVTVKEFEGEPFACAVARDITERQNSQKALQESEEKFRVIAETSPVALVISKAGDGVITYANDQAEALFEKSQDQLKRCSIVSLFENLDTKKTILDILSNAKEVHGLEVMLHSRNDKPLWLSLSTKAITLHGEQVICSAMLDITESLELSKKLTYHATYDALTGLVNRREFENRLQSVIDKPSVEGRENALCFMDLDQFKIINDTCGHIAGDELLRQLSQILQGCVRNGDTLARLGGDEFAVILENCPLENAEKIAHKIRQSVQDFRFSWHGSNFNIGISIGLVPLGSFGENKTEVLKRADTACYAAKDSGRNRIHIYRHDDEELVERHGEMQWVSRITSALDENRFELWKQVILPIDESIHEGDHYEILLRMRDEEKNIVLPGAFLPAAERYDLVTRIDRWVIYKIFSFFAENDRALENLSTCAINLSGQSMSDESLLEDIISLFENSNIAPQQICFEVTETAAIANLSYAIHFMNSLRNLGCKFALDDFGSGLSSFAYLKNLPVDYVKIDGLFVKDILSDPIDLAMVKSINDMGHAMGKFTIAEFVENDEILDKIRALKIDFAQGFGISRPQPLN